MFSLKQKFNIILSKGVIIVLLLTLLMPFFLAFNTTEQALSIERQSSNPQRNQNQTTNTQLSTGQENIVKRARQVFEFEWTPLRDIRMLDNMGTYRAGITIRGIPYGFPNESNYVPFNTSLADFLRESRNINSNLYTTQAFRIQDRNRELDGLRELYPELDNNGLIELILSFDETSEYSIYVSSSPFFSLDCSAFVSWAWGLERRLMTSALSTVADDMGNSIQNLQVGDALNKASDHVLLITDVKRNTRGNVTAVEVMEQYFRGTLRRTYGDDSEFTLHDFNSRYIDRGFTILRYTNRDDVVYVHDCVVPIDNDFCRNCFSPQTIYMLARVLRVNPDSEIQYLIYRSYLLLSR
ncbi:MAG: hypothetical protein LBC73_09605 [Oscillospiraceae bacterium]|jgi:hypothetical protein|nr:hypothetical protein [Oscillospiraceae bacterium]